MRKSPCTSTVTAPFSPLPRARSRKCVVECAWVSEREERAEVAVCDLCAYSRFIHPISLWVGGGGELRFFVSLPYPFYLSSPLRARARAETYLFVRSIQYWLPKTTSPSYSYVLLNHSELLLKILFVRVLICLFSTTYCVKVLRR
jgi:hypothetical protein